MGAKKIWETLFLIVVALPLVTIFSVIEAPYVAWDQRRRRKRGLPPRLSKQEVVEIARQVNRERAKAAIVSEPQIEDEYRLPTLPMSVFDPNQRDVLGITPLLDAVQNRNAAKVRRLLEAEADIEMRLPNSNETALILATKNNDLDIVLMLLRARAKVDACGYSGMTALMYAACYGYTPIARILLEYGADPNLTTEAGRSARFYASRSNRNNIGNLFEPLDRKA